MTPIRALTAVPRLIAALIAAALICLIAMMAYITITQYAMRFGFGFVQLAGLLWLLIGIGAGWQISRMNYRLGLHDVRLVALVALFSAWALLVFNWAGYSWFAFEGNWLRAGNPLPFGHLLEYITLSPQGWLDEMARWAQFSTIDYEDALGEGFEAVHVYWAEAAVLGLCAALMVMIAQRRI